MIKVSIIVLVYNSEKYLEKCIESIRSQTLQEIEIILVNDGSTDSSENICRHYEEIDHRIVVISQENAGHAIARNAGLDIVKGEFIGFVDSDDVIHHQMYEILYENANKYNADLVMGDAKKVYSNSEIKKELIEKEKLEIYQLTLEQFYLNMFANKNGIWQWISIWNKLYKKTMIGEQRFLYTSSEDGVIISQFCSKIQKIIKVHCQVYNWVQHAESITHRHYSQWNMNLVDSYMIMLTYMEKVCQDAVGEMIVINAKILLSNLYNSRGTAYERDTKVSFRKYRKMIVLRLMKHEKVKITQKMYLYICTYCPGIYYVFLNLLEIRAKSK
jgi:glycosyltransferase involved in cell wall biosynthesis